MQKSMEIELQRQFDPPSTVCMIRKWRKQEQFLLLSGTNSDEEDSDATEAE